MLSNQSSRQRYRIRVMAETDIPNMLGFMKAMGDFPYQKENLMDIVKKKSLLGVIALANESIAGFTFLKGQRIFDIYVAPPLRNRNIGTRIIGALKEWGINELSALVREDDLATQLFLANKNQFRHIETVAGAFATPVLLDDPAGGEYKMTNGYRMKYSSNPVPPVSTVNRITFASAEEKNF